MYKRKPLEKEREREKQLVFQIKLGRGSLAGSRSLMWIPELLLSWARCARWERRREAGIGGEGGAGELHLFL